ncbi:chloride channel protein [Paraglaciecola sp. 2405UD69-4]|uniref:chloride channel protein n=1 Tax=Paraglaciecola sp. 2405UD69-4 TaxID=3391836 RepID=UPI0039C97AFD
MNLNTFRKELATPHTSIQLCLIGIIGGVCAASLIILFRLTVDWLQTKFLVETSYYGDLAPSIRFALPIIGALSIILIAYLTGFKHYRMGIPFVIHRIKQFFGRIPFRTTVNQFLGGAVALASGFSVGREGPSVHLGAFGSSFFGQWFRLPNNSIRILSGCGIAAGISASFNTPFAAVIFVMEVVLREYRIHIFIPVMLAAACGSVMTRAVFGELQELSFIQFHDFSQWIYLYLIVFGMVLGAIATLFNNSLMLIMKRSNRLNMVYRLLIAGVVTGVVGVILPDSLGAHFDSAHAFIADNDSMKILIAVLCAKFFLTIVAIGLGIPGGVMGPVFVIGMISGAILVAPLGMFVDNPNDLQGSFSLLGMAGLMAAVVHAPLAALSAVMELSYSPQLILPAILVIVPAYVTSTQLLGNSSIFIRQLTFQKLPFTTSSVIGELQKTGVLSVMEENYKVISDNNENLVGLLDNPENTLVVSKSAEEEQIKFSIVGYDQKPDCDTRRITYSEMKGVRSQATLAEVYEILAAKRQGAVFVYAASYEEIIGIITWDILRNNLHKANY